MITILGIDPGLTGGFCWMADINGELVSLRTEPMPVIGKELDLKTANQYIIDQKVNCCYLEYSPFMHGKFSSSVLVKFGRVTGIIEGLLAANQIPYVLVNPRKWQNQVFQGCPKDNKPKDNAKLAASRLFPAHSFLKSDRCVKPHDGMVDAALIAEYGRRCLNKV